MSGYAFGNSSGSSSTSLSTSSVGGGNATWSNVAGDFTATANSGAKTITFSAYASTVLSAVIGNNNFGIVSIRRRTSAGVWDSIPTSTTSFVANVLTLSDMSANFAAGDTVEVLLCGPDKAYDETNDAAKTSEQNMASAEDNSNGVICTQNRPLPVTTYTWSVDKSGALEASSVTKNSAGVIRSFSGRVDSTAPTATYYLQILNAASLPADGAVTFLVAPTKIQHTTGSNSSINLDFTMNGTFASTGIVWCLSSTEFTKTISSAYVSSTVQYI